MEKPQDWALRRMDTQGSLNENGSPGPIYLESLVPTGGGAVWRRLGGVALLEEPL